VKLYTIYADEPGGDFTVYSINYSRGTHCWTYKVYANSIKEAYSLAARDVYARDAKSPGIRTLEADWWHRGSEPLAGEYIEAYPGARDE